MRGSSAYIVIRYLLFGQRASVEAEEESVRLPSHGSRVRLEEEGADEMHQSRRSGRFGKLTERSGAEEGRGGGEGRRRQRKVTKSAKRELRW